MLRGGRLAKVAVPSWYGPSRAFAEYSERPVPKSQRKPLVHGVLYDPVAVRDIKMYRLAKEWHVFKRRYEGSLMEAYKTFLFESEEARVTEKKEKRKERRDETAEIRHRHHLLQKKKHALLRDALIIRPW